MTEVSLIGQIPLSTPYLSLLLNRLKKKKKQIKNYWKIYLAGEGTFLFPFYVDTRDPLIELMVDSFQAKIMSVNLDNLSLNYEEGNE